MQDVLRNLAALELSKFCKDNGIDQSGTTTRKDGRGYKFSLYQIETGYKLLSVTFYKNSVPQFIMSVKAAEQRKAKIDRLRNNMSGYIFGELTEFASDSDVLEVCAIKDRKAEIHNRALERSKYEVKVS